jgi:hypothetical protein
MMVELEKIEQDLMAKVYLKLTGHLELEMNQMHFEYLHKETGISIRKLKELFGIYKKRSEKSYEYTMSKLAQFIGYNDWNAFVKQKVMKGSAGIEEYTIDQEPIQIARKVSVDLKSENKIVISVVVKGR